MHMSRPQILFCNAGHSSVGGASDCRPMQQSDGPWFDSGWPDIGGRGGGVPCDTPCCTCEFGPIGHPEHTSLLQRSVAAPCNEAPSAAPWNGSLRTMMCSCALHLVRQRETLCALERHIAIKAGYRNGSGCATMLSLWPCFRWAAFWFG